MAQVLYVTYSRSFTSQATLKGGTKIGVKEEWSERERMTDSHHNRPTSACTGTSRPAIRSLAMQLDKRRDKWRGAESIPPRQPERRPEGRRL